MPFLYKMVNTEKDSSLFNIFTYCYCDYDNPGGLNDYIYFTKKRRYVYFSLPWNSSIKKIKNIFFLWGQIIIFSSIF